MSGALNNLLEHFKARQALRHAMFAHLGVDIPDEKAQIVFEELRATMLACNRCCAPDTCRRWMTQGHRGIPDFCCAKDPLKALQRASRARPVLKAAAE